MAFEIATVRGGAIAMSRAFSKEIDDAPPPPARALDGAAVGDVVEFEAAGGEEEIEVLSIRWPSFLTSSD
jgi:hypothetical protein